MSPSSRRSLLVASTLAGLLAGPGMALPAMGASDHGLGDGSASNNPDLLRQGYEAAPTAYPETYEVLQCGGCGEVVYVPRPGFNPAQREPHDPYFDIDWNLSLRGAYVHTTSGERFEALLLPSVALTHTGNRWALNFAASAELVKPITSGELRVAALRSSGGFDYALDQLTLLSATAALDLTQGPPDEPLDLGNPDTVIAAPLALSGAVEAALSRRFGRFDLALRGSLGRTVYGPTTYAAPPVTDNSDQNFTETGAGLRIGFEATPMLTIFADGSVSRDWFDGPSSALLVSSDATTYAGKLGVSGQWNQVFEAEASVGFALRRFDAARLGEVTATLYDASLTFTPDEAWAFRAAFATSIAPPGPEGSGTARIDYEATAEASYRINAWLKLRASANWRAAELVGSTDSETGYGFGLGAEYQLNEHTALTADYGFSHAEITPDPAEDAHRVTLGVTFKR